MESGERVETQEVDAWGQRRRIPLLVGVCKLSAAVQCLVGGGSGAALLDRERVELFDADDGDAAPLRVLTRLGEVVTDLAAAPECGGKDCPRY